MYQSNHGWVLCNFLKALEISQAGHKLKQEIKIKLLKKSVATANC